MKVYILNYFYGDDVIHAQTVYKTFDAAREAMLADVQCVEEELLDTGEKRFERYTGVAEAYISAHERAALHRWEICEAKFIDK